MNRNDKAPNLEAFRDLFKRTVMDMQMTAVVLAACLNPGLQDLSDVAGYTKKAAEAIPENATIGCLQNAYEKALRTALETMLKST